VVNFIRIRRSNDYLFSWQRMNVVPAEAAPRIRVELFDVGVLKGWQSGCRDSQKVDPATKSLSPSSDSGQVRLGGYGVFPRSVVDADCHHDVLD